MEVTKSSNVSVPEITPLTKLQKYANNDLFVNVVSRNKSVKSALWLKEGGYEQPSVAHTDNISNKTVCYLAALQNLEITINNTEEIKEFETVLYPPDTFHSNWSKYPGNTRFDLKPEINIELQNLYIRVKGGRVK